jgi:CheY-like chemotaxis protein
MIKIMHVEDDDDIREIAEMALSLSGEFEVVQCVSGEAALARAPDYHPDVLLLDMMMPGMTGSETLEHLRKMPHMANVPAIFMTARAQHADIEQLRDNGAADVISKPFDPMTLGDQIKEILQAQVGQVCGLRPVA